MEYTNQLSNVYSDEEVVYLRGEKRNAPRGSRLPNAIPVWVRRKLLLHAEVRASQTMPAKQPTPKPVTPVSDDQRDSMARRLAIASL